MEKNDEDKVWVTISRTINLGNYESYKVEAGYSQTIGANAPTMLMEKMLKRITAVVTEQTTSVQEESLPKRKKKSSKHEDLDAGDAQY